MSDIIDDESMMMMYIRVFINLPSALFNIFVFSLTYFPSAILQLTSVHILHLNRHLFFGGEFERFFPFPGWLPLLLSLPMKAGSAAAEEGEGEGEGEEEESEEVKVGGEVEREHC